MKRRTPVSARTRKKISQSLRNKLGPKKLKNYGAKGAGIGAALGALEGGGRGTLMAKSGLAQELGLSATQVRVGGAAGGAARGAISGALVGSGYNRLKRAKTKTGRIVGGALLGVGGLRTLGQVTGL